MKKRPSNPFVLLTVIVALNIGVLIWFGVDLYGTRRSCIQAISVLGVIPLLALGWYTVYHSEHARAQNSLFLQSEILEHMSEGLALIRASDGAIVYTNGALENMFGYDPGEMINENVSIIRPSTNTNPRETKAGTSDTLDKTDTWVGRIHNTRKDGTPFWCHTSISTFDHPKHGKTLVSVYMDITIHKNAEEAVLEAGSQFRAIFENAGNPIVIINMETLEIKDFNDKACENLGYTREEFAELSISDINTAESRDALKEYIQTVLRDGSVSFDTKHITKMGDVRDASVTITTVKRQKGVLCIGMWHDITKRTKVMNEIKRLSKFPAENPNPVLRVSRRGVLIYANDAGSVLLENWDCSVGEPLARPWRDHARECYTKAHGMEIEAEIGDQIFSLKFVPVERSGYLNIYGQDVTERKKVEKALREEMDFAKSLVNTAQAIVLVLDTKGRIVSFNPYMEEISGYALKEVVGRDWFSTFLPKQDRGKIRKIFKDAVNNIRTRGNINPIVTKDGEERHIEWYDKTLRDDDGNVTGLLAVGQDITERLGVQEEQNRLLKAVETAREAINIATPDGRIIYTNEAMDELFGYERGELIGKSAKILNAGSNPEAVVMRVIDDIKEKDWWQGELHNVRKDGSEFFTYVTVSATRNKDGNVANIIVTQHDITERKKLFDAIKESEERFRTLFEEGPLGMAVLDSNLTMVMANAALCRMLGYSAGELAGLEMSTIIHPDDTDITMKYIKRLFNGKISRGQSEKRYTDKDGRVVWGNLTASIIPYQGNKFAYALAVIEDITERKEVEEKVQIYQKQLRSLGTQLTLAEERQRKKIATALHDGVCQSIAMAKMKLDLLRDDIPSGGPTDDLAEVGRMLTQAIQDTRTLTFDLSPPILYELGLEAALAELVDEHARHRHDTECEFEDDEQPKPLHRDTTLLLYQSVRELLVNIVKYAEAGKVKVLIRKDTDTVEIVVEDNGIGFDPDEVAFRPDRTGGFGLFSIRERLGYLGGRFEIESKPQRGTRVTLEAPLMPDS